MHSEACNALGALKHFDHVVNVPPRRLKQFMFVCGCRPVYLAPRGAAVSGADSGQHVMRMLSCTTITCRRTAGSGWWKPQSWLIVASAYVIRMRMLCEVVVDHMKRIVCGSPRTCQN